MSTKRYWGYILTNVNDTVLYIGVTGDIERRVREHKTGEVEGFTQQYNLTKLVYLEEFGEVRDALCREKQLKNWKRTWKEELVRKKNPSFDDLSKETPISQGVIPDPDPGSPSDYL